MAKHIEFTCLVCGRSLDQDAENGFILSTTLRNDKEFSKAFTKSDIPQIIARFAENAIHHIKHLENKLSDKTEAKMYPTPSHSGHLYRKPPQKKRPG